MHVVPCGLELPVPIPVTPRGVRRQVK
jgi:hypothetical protein